MDISTNDFIFFTMGPAGCENILDYEKEEKFFISDLIEDASCYMTQDFL